MPFLESVTMERFEAGRRTCRTIILPCGALEEHGRHLPLGTDTLHAIALARSVSEKTGVWVAPPVHYGLCRSGSQHPGTVGIRGSTLKVLVQDIIRSLYEQGVRQAIVLSGHAGGTHMAALVDAGEELMAELPEIKMAVVSVLDIAVSAWEGILETPGDFHAGEAETSLMLHLHPDWVQGTAPEEYPAFPKHILVRNKRRFWPGGVWGDPGKADPGKGKALVDRSVAALVKLVEDIETWREEPRAP